MFPTEVVERIKTNKHFMYNNCLPKIVPFMTVAYLPVAYPGILFRGGGSTNLVVDRENGDLGAVAP
jgi:hypothetical protein